MNTIFIDINKFPKKKRKKDRIFQELLDASITNRGLCK